MGNDNHYNIFPEENPKVNHKKYYSIDFWASKGVEFKVKVLERFIYDKTKKYLADNVKPVVVTMDQENNREIIYPPKPPL